MSDIKKLLALVKSAKSGNWLKKFATMEHLQGSFNQRMIKVKLSGILWKAIFLITLFSGCTECKEEVIRRKIEKRCECEITIQRDFKNGKYSVQNKETYLSNIYDEATDEFQLAKWYYFQRALYYETLPIGKEYYYGTSIRDPDDMIISNDELFISVKNEDLQRLNDDYLKDLRKQAQLEKEKYEGWN